MLLSIGFVIAVPPPPPPVPEGLGGSAPLGAAEKNDVRDEISAGRDSSAADSQTVLDGEEIPPFIKAGEKQSTKGQGSQTDADKLSSLEKRVEELEKNSGFFSTPIIILFAFNIVILGLIIYLLQRMHPGKPDEFT
jgi:hypothetical protein